ncbi:hypothetical protein E1N52_40370 [Paraburkholderia guartelaensis]|uniref:DUF4239 domain-containing protein n=1 Tax=Paraburkholderia guartelaensis TaxID=2546446 RepID=A0A4R5L442_9BURK|nr:hypothetical protein [Paraburkholderia guartelaensis]TDG02307.1 hypothetical protein E1N52_40370 [Paraburkholderia guartelaensis]
MYPLSSALLVLALLVSGALIGVVVRPLSPEEHKAHQTLQLVQLVDGMLVTFAALVLGLMTASAKSTFDNASDDFRALASDLVQFDITARQYGPDADPVRQRTRVYLAAAIASTWRHEPLPPGNDYPRNLAPKDVTENLDDVQLDQMLNSAGIEWRRLVAHDRYHQDLLDDGRDQFARIVQAHWKLIQEVHSSISLPFFMTLAFWLFVIFLSFGLMAPRNPLVLITIMLGAVSIASVAYVIVDLDTLFRGMIVVSSHPLRDALTALAR